MQDLRTGRPDVPSAAEGARRCRGPRVGTVHRAWDVLRGVQAEWEGLHGQEHCVSPPPNLHPTSITMRTACPLPSPTTTASPTPCMRGRRHATMHRHYSAKNVWTTAPCRNKVPGTAIRAHSEGRKVTAAPRFACLSMPMFCCVLRNLPARPPFCARTTSHMLPTNPPADRPTDRPTCLPTYRSTGDSF